MARILIVEDEVLIASMIADCIEELGHQVVGPAATVGDALSLIEQQAPQFAILDLSLGKQQSLPVADALDRLGCDYTFATGYGAAGLPEAYKAKKTLRKPFFFDDVEKALAHLKS